MAVMMRSRLLFKPRNLLRSFTNTTRLSSSCTCCCSLAQPKYNSFLVGYSRSQIRASFFHTSAQARSKLVPYKLSDIGEGIKEVVIKEWFVQPGSEVAQFDEICEVQSDKASVTITSRYDGIVRKLYYGVDDTAQVGDPLVDIEVSSSEEGTTIPLDSAAVSETPVAEDSTFNEREPPTASTKILATPVVRKMATDHNVDIQKVAGSGPNGRILKEDILKYSTSPKQEESQPQISDDPIIPEALPTLPLSQPPAPADKVVKMSMQQKAMSKLMTSALQIPHFSYCDEFTMDALVKLRKQLKHVGETEDVKLTFLPFILKALSLALTQYPQLNATLRPTEEVVVLKHSHNIGVAMDTPGGLMVPNVKNCETKSVLEIARELAGLQRLADAGKLTQSHFQGATISVSNVGALGGTYAKPVIAPPEVAIVALGRTRVLPRFDNQMNVFPSSIMCVSWSADHRVLDGATVCRASNLWKEYVENPAKMLLHLQ